MISDEKLAELERLEREATPNWQQATHIDEPRALVSADRPMVSLLGLDRDGMAIFEDAEDCAVAVAARNALSDLVRELRQLRAIAMEADAYRATQNPYAERSAELRLRKLLNDYFATDGGATK